MLRKSIKTKKYWDKFWISKSILYMIDSFFKGVYFTRIKANYIKKLMGKNSMVLEIGCGNGKLLESVSKNKTSVGLDLSEFILKKARKNFVNQKIKLVLGDIFNTQFNDEIFDFVFCDGLIEHYTDKIETLIKKMYILTKNGGIILAILTNNNFIRKILFKFLYSWDRRKIVNTEDYKKIFLKILPNISNNYKIEPVPKSFGILMAVWVKKC